MWVYKSVGGRISRELVEKNRRHIIYTHKLYATHKSRKQTTKVTQPKQIMSNMAKWQTKLALAKRCSLTKITDLKNRHKISQFKAEPKKVPKRAVSFDKDCQIREYHIDFREISHSKHRRLRVERFGRAWSKEIMKIIKLHLK